MKNSSKHPLPRCRFRSPGGRQCRFSGANATSGLCPRHHAINEHRTEDLTQLFTIAHDKFRSPAGIHAALSEIFTLLAEDRISARRAAVLAYISNLLLRTQLAIRQEAADQHAAGKNAPPKIIWDLLDLPRQQDAARQAAASLPEVNQSL